MHLTQDQEFPSAMLGDSLGSSLVVLSQQQLLGAGKPLGLQNSLELVQELSQGLLCWKQLILRNALILIIALILINTVDFDKCIHFDKCS